jgi:hypothetical protein
MNEVVVIRLVHDLAGTFIILGSRLFAIWFQRCKFLQPNAIFEIKAVPVTSQAA